MNCFMFPGQPLSYDSALPDDADFAQIAELVRRVTHLDLASLDWLDGEGTDNLKLQLYGTAQSLYRLRQLRRQGVCPDLVAQHSMGIYPALVACGSIQEEHAIEITWRIGSCVSDMGKTQRYAFGSVIGLALEPVSVLSDNNRVHLANHNTSRHFLLSGKRDDVRLAIIEAMEAGAFSARIFSCDAPLHTPLMAQLAKELRGIVAEYRYAEPACPLMNHLDQRYLAAADIPGFLLRELSLPVHWERTYRALRAAGAVSFFEVGAGQALKKYNRWIEGEIDA